MKQITKFVGQVTHTVLKLRDDEANTQEMAVSYNLKGEVTGTVRF